MRLFKFKPIFLFFVLPALVSCKPEPAPPSTAKEIITEISREWSCVTAGDDGQLAFNAIISADPNSDSKIFVTNFHKIGPNDKIYAIVNTDLSIVIPEQTIGNQVFEGTGEISNDYTEITWDYTILYEGGTLNISATFNYGVTS